MSHEVEDFLQSLKSNAEVVFDDGTRFEGISFGADVSASGEAVFQTGKQSFITFITFITSSFNHFILLDRDGWVP